MAAINVKNLLDEADQKKAGLDSFRPLSSEFIQEMNEWFIVEFTYSSNALEGNTLSARETALVIQKDIAITGKSLREHLEAVGHSVAVEYILDLAKCRTCELTLGDIINIYKLIFDRIEKEHAGINRNIELPLTPATTHYNFPPLKFHAALDNILSWLCSTTGHPILVAAETHFKIITLRPFNKGNGIIARLLMNLVLLQKGYEPAIILPEDRASYDQLLDNAYRTNNLDSFFKFITKKVIDTFDFYLSKVKPPL